MVVELVIACGMEGLKIGSSILIFRKSMDSVDIVRLDYWNESTESSDSVHPWTFSLGFPYTLFSIE